MRTLNEIQEKLTTFTTICYYLQQMGIKIREVFRIAKNAFNKYVNIPLGYISQLLLTSEPHLHCKCTNHHDCLGVIFSVFCFYQF